MPLYHVYGISFGNKKPDNVDWDYIVLLSNLIEEGTVHYRVGLKLILSSDSLCHFSTALTYRIRKAGTIARVLSLDLPLAQFPIW